MRMNRIDTELLKRDHPIEEIARNYGIELYPSGRALVGRCPFHVDGGRPNFNVYPSDQSWYCYRCSIGGDVISFVERIDGVGFRDAVSHLTEERLAVSKMTNHMTRTSKPFARRRQAWGPDERGCLSAAVELYHNRLLNDPVPLAYLHGRGLDRDIIERCCIGYVTGNELAAYLQWRGLPIGAAMRVGLLRRGGREFLAGRVVVPEIRAGQPIWLVGRTIDPEVDGPKYLGLPGHKPLLGWEAVQDSREVFLVEGVFDWLTLLNWGYPALALVGTHARRSARQTLEQFERVWLVLDDDEAGQMAAEDLADALGSRAVVVALLGIKDVGELAARHDGLQIFARAVHHSKMHQAA